MTRGELDLNLSIKISTCYDLSEGLSNDELRAVSSAQILHKTSSERQLK